MEENDYANRQLNAMKRENRTLDARVLQLFALYNVSKSLSLTIQMDEIFGGAMSQLVSSLGIDDFCIMLYDEKDKKLKTHAVHSDVDLSKAEFRLGEGVTGTVAQTGKAKLIQDVSKEPDFLFYKGKKKNIGSFLCLPLKGRDAGIMGVLNVHRASVFGFEKQIEMGFDPAEVDFFKEVADHIAIALEKAQSFDRVKRLAMTDELTGAYNRRHFFEYFEKEIQRAKRYNHSFSVAIIDVDHFKTFNDTNGHPLGDKVLKKVVQVLTKNLRSSDVLARIGGEEFVVALPETDMAAALKVAEKLRKSIEKTRFEGGETQPGGRVTVTIGLSNCPDDAGFASELMSHADKALYRGKAMGRNAVIPFLKED